MLRVSRRKFLKGMFAGVTVLSVIPFFRTSQKVTLSVDEDGNAILIGAEIIVDEHAKATLL